MPTSENANEPPADDVANATDASTDVSTDAGGATSAADSSPAADATAASVPAAFAAKLKRSRVLNVVLGAVALFLAVVVTAQQLGGGITPPEAVPSAPAASAPAASTPAQPQATLAEQVVGVDDPANPMAMGPVGAPLTIVEWTDYRCPFCASFTNTTLPTIIDEYVDAGLVRYEVRDVAFFGDESLAASIAGRAAAKQGRFFEFMHVLYAAAPASGHPDMPREKLLGFAEAAGVPDLAAFEADLDDPALHASATASTTTAQQMGVNSVPFFVIGDETFAGAQPVANFRAVIDAALAAAQTTD